MATRIGNDHTSAPAPTGKYPTRNGDDFATQSDLFKAARAVTHLPLT
jgi:hypothetical protein